MSRAVENILILHTYSRTVRCLNPSPPCGGARHKAAGFTAAAPRLLWAYSEGEGGENNAPPRVREQDETLATCAIPRFRRIRLVFGCRRKKLNEEPHEASPNPKMWRLALATSEEEHMGWVSAVWQRQPERTPAIGRCTWELRDRWRL